MQEPPNLQRQIESVLARLSALVSARNVAVIEEFSDTFLLVGSEATEVASDAHQLRELLLGLFAQTARVSWEWHRISSSGCGDTAWFFAEGEVVLTSDTAETRKPYRLSGVLLWQGERWLWKQFHGSEPAT